MLCLCCLFFEGFFNLALNSLSFVRDCWESGEKPVGMGKLAFELPLLPTWKENFLFQGITLLLVLLGKHLTSDLFEFCR